MEGVGGFDNDFFVVDSDSIRSITSGVSLNLGTLILFSGLLGT